MIRICFWRVFGVTGLDSASAAFVDMIPIFFSVILCVEHSLVLTCVRDRSV
jgi:hypothetical protein